MIIWIQRAFGRHNKWILMVFLIVLLVSFIIGIGAVPRGSLAGNRTTSNQFMGLDLNSKEDMLHLQRAVMFTAGLNGSQVDSDQQLLQMMDMRMALKYTTDQWQIPEPTPKQVDDYVQTLPIFLDADGKFSANQYVAFREKLMASAPAERDEYINILKENCRLDRALQLMGGPGYRVPGLGIPTLMQIAGGKDNFKFNLEVATLDRTKFEAKIDEKEPELTAALTKIFEASPNRFQRPPEVDLALVKFPIDQVPAPTDPNVLREYLTKNKAKFPEITTEIPTPANWEDVAKAWRMDEAKAEAMKFAQEEYALNTTYGSPAFAALLKKFNKTVVQLPTLVQGKAVTADSPVADDVLQDVAFNLSPQNPLTPVPMTDSAGILFFVKGTPPTPSTLAQAHDDVLKLYREQETTRQFGVKEGEVGAALTKAMAEGKTFREAAKAQGLTVKEYAGVTDTDLFDAGMFLLDPTTKDKPTTNPLVPMGRDLIVALTKPDDNHVPLLLTLQPGDTSKMLTEQDSGMVVHVIKREPAEIAVDSAEMRLRLDRMARQESQISASFNLTRVLNNAKQTLKPNGS